jgi:hypothetical protein
VRCPVRRCTWSAATRRWACTCAPGAGPAATRSPSTPEAATPCAAGPPSGSGGRARSEPTLLAEPDFSLASFLLSVLGEGSFLSLLAFLGDHAPDPITRQVTRLARVDEARQVAFGEAHLEHQSALDPALRGKLRAAVERRHDALVDTAGLNADVLDALVVLAAGEWTAAAIARGYGALEELQHAMDDGRRQRLARLGFPPDEAAELSALRTRNFM